jgi:hypothetical protein
MSAIPAFRAASFRRRGNRRWISYSPTWIADGKPGMYRLSVVVPAVQDDARRSIPTFPASAASVPYTQPFTSSMFWAPRYCVRYGSTSWTLFDVISGLVSTKSPSARRAPG